MHLRNLACDEELLRTNTQGSGWPGQWDRFMGIDQLTGFVDFQDRDRIAVVVAHLEMSAVSTDRVSIVSEFSVDADEHDFYAHTFVGKSDKQRVNQSTRCQSKKMFS